MEIIRATGNPSHFGDLPSISLRCPRCGDRGSFEGVEVAVADAALTDVQSGASGAIRAGSRRCPAADCRALVFFARDEATLDLVVTYPPEVLDFDATDLPAAVRDALEEAVKCHAAGCWKAAAMMVRKSIESMCDERQAEGPNLKERIKSLRSKVILPDDLFEAIDELRLLGNDAAHVAAREYDDVGREEVEVGLMMAKEILKAVYQYKSLVAKMRGLKTDG